MVTNTICRKYELTDEPIIENGHTLYRIRALRDIPRYSVKAGDLGGFVESEANLSHEGDCWVDDYACVYEEARVSENAVVGDWARVSGRACISGNASVHGEARAFGYSQISGNASVCDRARVFGKARIAGWAHVREDACIFEEARVHDYSRAKGEACISGRACVEECACITGHADVSGLAHVGGCVYVDEDAEITETGHVFFAGPVGMEKWFLGGYRTKGGGYRIDHNDQDDFLVFTMGGFRADFDREYRYGGKYRFLLEMARNDPENWPDNEYRFAIGMILNRAEYWKQSVKHDKEIEQKSSTFQKDVVSAPKYELTDETRIVDGCTLYRIRALRDIPRYSVWAGTLGGFVESETNLSHEGDCWISGKACVYDEAHVSGDAYVALECCISGNAHIAEHAIIRGSKNLCISGNAFVGGCTKLYGGIRISDDAEIADDSHVLFMGPIGPHNQYLIAYRTKGGGYCIRDNDGGDIAGLDGVPAKVITGSANDEGYDDNYRLMLKMDRGDPEKWQHDELLLTIEMARCHAERWRAYRAWAEGS